MQANAVYSDSFLDDLCVRVPIQNCTAYIQITNGRHTQVRARMDREIEAPDPEKFPWEKAGYLIVQVCSE